MVITIKWLARSQDSRMLVKRGGGMIHSPCPICRNRKKQTFYQSRSFAESGAFSVDHVASPHRTIEIGTALADRSSCPTLKCCMPLGWLHGKGILKSTSHALQNNCSLSLQKYRFFSFLWHREHCQSKLVRRIQAMTLPPTLIGRSLLAIFFLLYGKYDRTLLLAES